MRPASMCQKQFWEVSFEIDSGTASTQRRQPLCMATSEWQEDEGSAGR
jgi:hypothetical protein